MNDLLGEGEFEQRFFSGQHLYGDDFDAGQIAQWFADEEHGYYDLVQADGDGSGAEYGYEALNRLHAFDHLPVDRRFAHALGFGSNYGYELLPVLQRCDRVTLLDASNKFEVKELSGVPVDYRLAQVSGDIDLPDASVNLLTCFGVLHHIPNVSKVLGEFHRVLAPGGMALIREPTTTMGDWRRPRRGLTARERGIPRELFQQMVRSSGLRIVRTADCFFPPWIKALNLLKLPTTSSSFNVRLDAVLARAFRFNYVYHRSSFWSRFGPASLFLIAERPH